jgi:amidohydrolase
MDHFRIKVIGRAGHTSTPHLTINPILVASQIALGLQAIFSSETDPFLTGTLSLGLIKGGSAANIIPETVEMEGTIRYLFDASESGPHRTKAIIKEITEGLAQSYRAKASADFYCSQPALYNHPEMAALGRIAALETIESSNNLVSCQNLGGEDFSEFALRVPSAFAVIGCGGSKACYPHHHPKFQIEEQSLSIGLEWLLRTSLLFFNKGI